MQVMQARIARSRMAGEPPHVLVSPRLGHLGVLAGQQESDRFGQPRPRVDRTGCKIRSA
jgi:NTE family protein